MRNLVPIVQCTFFTLFCKQHRHILISSVRCCEASYLDRVLKMENIIFGSWRFTGLIFYITITIKKKKKTEKHNAYSRIEL